MPRKYTTEDFIKKAKEIHKNKYNYSLVDYIGTNIKVKIICPIHGVFEQLPRSHIIYGCKKCGNENAAKVLSSSVEEFIKKATKIHGNKYDYSLVEYVNAEIKIKIVCPIHGVFYQSPHSHLKGYGCQKCGIEKAKKVSKKNSENRRLTFDSFVKKANKKHDIKYNYYNIDIKKNKQRIKINCLIHGDFIQSVDSHLRGADCPKCSLQRRANILRKTKNQFIKESQIVHKNKYDYSLVNYITTHKRVEIVCPIHGSFFQTPNAHLKWSGCPKCNNSIGELKIRRHLENKNIEYELQKKFDNCKNSRKLPFDFYLPKYNVCIEYDGIQHFDIVTYFGGRERLLQTQINDKIKTEFCKQNKISLLRIKYNEKIENKLDYFLNNNLLKL